MADQPNMEAQYTLDSSGTNPLAVAAISSAQGSASSDRSTEKRSGSRDSASSRGSALQREAFAAQPSLGRFGQYDLKAILGSGGFGVVYHAWDTQLGRQVAVKVPRFDMTEERKVRRFRQEARAAAKLQHPNIVVVLDEGTQDGKPYIVSEFVDGEPLSVRIERDRPNLRLAVQWVRDLAVALDYAHDQGVVHRDIKPENIMLGKHGRPQIMDFGLAKQLDEDSSLSIDGSVMGTPNYMAPEQARGEISAVDGRSDQYSLGVILYELLTGTKPFSGPAHAVLAKVADPHFEPPAPRSHDATISKDIEAICQRAMSKAANQRYTEMQAFADDLDRWLEGKPTDARPLGSHERAARWCRRNPALAGSGAAISLGLLIIMGLVWKLAAADTSPAIAQADLLAAEVPASEVQENLSDTPDTAPPAGSSALVTPTSTPTSPPAAVIAPPAPPWQPTPEQQAFFDQVAALPVEDQAAAVAKKLQEVNPEFDSQYEQKIKENQVTEFAISTDEVTGIWPVRALARLQSLRCVGTPVAKGKLADLSPFSGMTLSSLAIENNQVVDLSPLAGMPLEHLWISSNRVSDLAPLVGMNTLRVISAYSNALSDLSPLRDTPLTYLNCGNNPKVSDLSTLSGLPLQGVSVNSTSVASLTALRNMPIRHLVCSNTLISDFQPLLRLPLDDLRFPLLMFYAPDQTLIRNLPASKLGNDYNEELPAEDFWKRFDERRKAVEQFVMETSQLSFDQQIAQVKSKLHELNDTNEISLTANPTGQAIESLVVRLTSSSADITPLRALTQLKQLTIGNGRPWLDLSPINSLPIEELVCRKEQAMRNRLMLAEIQTLKMINGQPAEEYLATLKVLSESKPESSAALATIATEADILTTHPPLDQWLNGREILTVAQDGSATFTSIQAALDAQQNGQVVQVLDKGPYREKLTWKNKHDCGLISLVNTAVLIPDDLEPTDPSARVSHDFSGLSEFRLHGLTFLYKPGKGSGHRGLINITQSKSPCIESIVVMPMTPRLGHFYPDIWWTIDNGGAICLRNSVFCGHQITFNVPAGCQVDVSRNWFRSRSGSIMGTSGVRLKHSSDIDATVLVTNNITDRQCANSTELSSDFTRMQVTYRGNTTAGRTGRTITAVGLLGKQVAIENNLNLVNRNMCNFYGGSSSVTAQAKKLWTIKNNYSNGIHTPERGGDLPLGDPHPSEIRMLSIDPLDRNFMRVDPSSITVPEGDPFPGALPPGPAPPEGDWFTKLQERFRDALQFLPEGERDEWTRSVELPKPAASEAPSASAVPSTEASKPIPVVTDEAMELDFTYLPSGYYQRFRSYRPLTAAHAPKVPRNLTLPKAVAKPYYGEIVSGNLKWPYIVDKPGDSPPKVYVDANADGDLTNDPPLTWTGKKSGPEFYYEAEFDVRLPDGKPAKVVANTRFFPSKLLHHTDFGYFAYVMLGTDKVMLVHEGHFSSNSYFTVFPEKSPKLGSRIGGPFEFKGTKYFLKLRGDKVLIKSGEDFGAEVAVGGQSVAVGDGQPAVDAGQPQEPPKFPKTVQFAPNDGQPLVDRKLYPPEVNQALQDPRFKLRLEAVEQVYANHERKRPDTTPPGVIVFGKVVSEDPTINPRIIESHAQVHAGGYFVDFVPEMGTLTAFSLHGHQAVEIEVKGPQKPTTSVFVEDLGTIRLKKLERRDNATLRGFVQLRTINGRLQKMPAEVAVQVVPHLDRHPDQLALRRSPGGEDGKPFMLNNMADARGMFSFSGLSPEPTRYRITATHAGHLPASEEVSLKSGARNPLTPVTIEEKIPYTLESIQYRIQSFSPETRRSIELLGGESLRFSDEADQSLKVSGPMGATSAYAAVGTVDQRDGILTLRLGPNGDPIQTGARDLGDGKLDDFVDIQPAQEIPFESQDLQLKNGHVHLIRIRNSSGMLNDTSLESTRKNIYDQSRFILIRVTSNHLNGN